MRKIGLLGGSFDPIHDGHLLIAKTAYKKLKLDELWFIPVLNNPFKDRKMIANQDRVAMLELALKKYPYFKVNDIELHGNPNEKSYTYNTLVKLKEQYPDVKFYYLIGDDQVAKFDQWYKAEKISQMVKLIAMARGGYELHYANQKKYRMKRITYRPLKVSSSVIREGHLKYLNPKVLEYMTLHGLYLDTIVASFMSEKRYQHTISMASLAVEIAQANHLDTTKVYVAGMLHDIAKEMEPKKARKLMKKHYPKHLAKPPAVWHQWLSSYLAKKKFHIHDKEILQAIENHTTASCNMSLLDMCIYVADKYDRYRGFDSEAQITLCKQDLQAGFTACLVDFYQFSQTKKRPIDPVFYEVYKKYKERVHE